MLPEERERLLDYYIGTSGFDRSLLKRLGESALTRMAELLRMPGERRKLSIIQALSKAITSESASEKAKEVGKAAIYDALKSTDADVRAVASEAVPEIDGAAATDTLIQMISDPVESVRIIALSQLGLHGRTNAAAQIASVLAERARGLSKEQVRIDGTFKFGQIAVSRLKAREQGRSVQQIVEDELRIEEQQMEQSRQNPSRTRPP